MRGYCFITDSALSRAGNVSDVRSALAGGAAIIQYREKNASQKKMYEEALLLRKICRKAIFIINDRPDIALAVGADGVHIGQGDMPYHIARRLLGKDKIIGVTAHNLKEAIEAERMGADYVGVSPIYRTATKKDAGSPVGIGLIRKIKERVSIPVVAIGGITSKNAGEVVAAGADAICSISDVITKSDVKKAVSRLQSLF